MEVNCEGCAGCCMDWRPLLADASKSTGSSDGDDGGNGVEPNPERRHRRRREPSGGGNGRVPGRDPLDDDPNFVPLTRDEVRAFLEAGIADALTPRFWEARDESEGVDVDGRSIAAVAGRPAFFVGLRKPPKPVAPFDREEPRWLPTCVFLDPTTLQCRIHESELFPDECSAYPEYNLALEQQTECERVEDAVGGDRLLEASHDEPEGLLLGSQALGTKVFAHPQPGELEGVVDRTAAGTLGRRDRAEPIAVAAASSPGTLAISEHHYQRAKARVLDDEDPEAASENGSSWVGPAIRDWHRRYRDADEVVPSTDVADAVETARGASETPGWDDPE
ncbi:YkgJ family cysteine cluster protein [Natrinema halophilum]|uniref:YkgJ family cysteine cluster protein n=1 Tax=Natrinema halophilum TaxID=1699371 RepID=A0A7D5L3G1_9EURY|nr:YkgJ family cysteine cluster protein [Natrinema halophilum]QLG49665.1 YkgJ family cysteine cluster protein [Natrinema halophilum]